MALIVNENSVINLESEILKIYPNCNRHYYKQSIKEVNERRQKVGRFEHNQIMWEIDAYVSEHALKRWNERVGGEYFSNEDELANYLSLLLSTSVSRFDVLESPTKDFDTYLIEIDEEILASVKLEKNLITFLSFFGRQSMKPALRNWWTLRSYLRKQAQLKKEKNSLELLLEQLNKTQKTENFSSDKIDLSLTLEELNQQKLPALPIKHWNSKDHKHKYAIEKYFVTDQKEPVYVIFRQRINANSQEKPYSYLVNPNEESSYLELPKSVRRKLKEMEPLLFNEDGHLVLEMVAV